MGFGMDGPIKTEVNFVAGFDGICPAPPAVRKTGLDHRFAVIQETYRPDSPDMYFDAALWLCLLDFACSYAPGAEVRIGKAALPLDVFLRNWQASDDPDPEPVEVRQQGEFVLYVAPEFWANIGGPAPYADSYTYAVFSREDLSGPLMAHLRDGDTDHRWMLASQAMPANQIKKRKP
jgi:hypothetical protein